MVLTEDIGAKAYEILSTSDVANEITGVIGWERNDYSKEDIIIIPHTITGEGMPRYGEVKINIHVPDPCTKPANGEPIYHTNMPRLTRLKKMCIEVLKSHYESGEGWNWAIGPLGPPIPEQGHNEHFASLSLAITARDK